MFAGDGWSARAEDAILHGCVPVLVMDDVQPIWDGVLDWDSFSVRIAVSGALTLAAEEPGWNASFISTEIPVTLNQIIGDLASCVPVSDFACGSRCEGTYPTLDTQLFTHGNQAQRWAMTAAGLEHFDTHTCHSQSFSAARLSRNQGARQQSCESSNRYRPKVSVIGWGSQGPNP